MYFDDSMHWRKGFFKHEDPEEIEGNIKIAIPIHTSSALQMSLNANGDELK